MDGKLNWNGIKRELWKKDPKDLMKKLQELEKDKFKLEIELRAGGKSADRRYGYDSLSRDVYRGGNLQKIKKQIACIKTMLNVKLKAGQHEN